MLLLGFCGPATSQETISRLEFCEKLSIACLHKPLTEVEIIQSGIIDPQPDGRFHLDWPISRADAARVCQKLLEGVPNSRPLPGFFADIQVASPFYTVLVSVGGAFPPLPQDRFGPDVLMTGAETDQVARVLQKHLPQQRDWDPPPPPDAAAGDVATASWGRQFPMDFRFSPIDEDADAVIPPMGTATERLSRLSEFVPPAQFAPQPEFSLRTAITGMDALEETLNSLELSILDLVNAEVANSTQKSQLRDGLTQFRDIINPLVEKLRYSRMELRAALLTDSESLRLAEQLDKRISESQRRLNRLLELLKEKMKRVQ